jgi:transposase
MDASRFSTTMGGLSREAGNDTGLIAIDLGKRSFHLHGIDRDGVVLSRKIGRGKLFAGACAV